MTRPVALTAKEQKALAVFLGELTDYDVQDILSRDAKLAERWQKVNRTLDRIYDLVAPVRPS